MISAYEFPNIDSDKRPFCKTIPEAVEFLQKTLPEEVQDHVRYLPEDRLIRLHFTLGAWIRNNIPVWGNKELCAPFGKLPPDGIGGLILLRFWEALQ